MTQGTSRALPEVIKGTVCVLRAVDGDARGPIDAMASDPAIADTFFEYGIAALDAEILFAVTRRRDPSVIGAVCLDQGRIGFFIKPELWARGYARDAVSAFCTALAASGVEFVEAVLIRENVASLRVLERAGFRFCGLAPRRIGPGTGHTTLLYRRDFRP